MTGHTKKWFFVAVGAVSVVLVLLALANRSLAPNPRTAADAFLELMLSNRSVEAYERTSSVFHYNTSYRDFKTAADVLSQFVPDELEYIGQDQTANEAGGNQAVITYTALAGDGQTYRISLVLLLEGTEWLVHNMSFSPQTGEVSWQSTS